ncbi:MAG: DUF1579 domain-containing protein [Holophaga sp.]
MRIHHLFLALPMFLAAQEAPLPKPTPHHLAMKRMEGTWDAVVKVQMAPGQPPMVSKGVEVNKLVPGGLWLQSEFKSDMMGMPFEGRGLFGYDPALGKHVGTWVDSMVYSLGNPTGTCKDDCKETICYFKGPGMDGKMVTYKEITVEHDADHRTMTMFIKGKKGAFVQNMVIEYTRRK